jgi:hypothetical protein
MMHEMECTQTPLFPQDARNDLHIMHEHVLFPHARNGVPGQTVVYEDVAGPAGVQVLARVQLHQAGVPVSQIYINIKSKESPRRRRISTNPLTRFANKNDNDDSADKQSPAEDLLAPTPFHDFPIRTTTIISGNNFVIAAAAAAEEEEAAAAAAAATRT